jgi:hypothetical protein
MALIQYKTRPGHEGILHIGDEILLMPGITKVDDKAWAAAKKIALVKDHFLKKGILAELGPAKDEKGEKKESDKLCDREEGEALELVSQCNSIPTLEAWFFDEKRPLVRDAVSKRVDLLSTPDAKEQKDAKGGQ